MKQERINAQELNLKDKVVYINRVAKVVKGGRRFSFSALVVVGNEAGIVGVGKGKAAEVPDAIRKAIDKAKKNLIKFPLKDTTIPHRVEYKYGATTIVINPAPKGTGIIAGGPARAVFEVAGVQDVVAKVLGSHNPFNSVKATIGALRSLKEPSTVTKFRMKPSELESSEENQTVEEEKVS
ncbi:small subunit ribosomal protein S5 [Thermodesulfovibrio aggregans]|uniref:Small ribosomal subunit protein uS5 n=1 Tax=Thermodesulfovibrio aggregans TaxID=86166 RepID=A0A0U9HS08_9BACT|nr:30S ribosomal protein S5 [Thermodesulfovibrio aggregans]GAQ95815.1 small subunit ribosomal protein S5 [Thermodesulfovibrio aggregans]